MAYKTFNRDSFNVLEQPMFFGRNVNVSRYDQQKYPIFESLIEKQLSFFWRPEEVDLSTDRSDFADLPEHEKHIFISNLKYQTLLDSIQGRSPNMAFLPIVSLPELETWIETWAFSETIHSRSYTHIIRNTMPNPTEVFDSITQNDEIVERAASVTEHYDALIYEIEIFHTLGLGTHTIKGETVEISMRSLKKKLYLTMVSVNVLEAVRFYVSFACSFAFAERAKMEGNAKIIKLIARDEALHLTGTQHILQHMAAGRDDPEMGEIAKECQGDVVRIFMQAARQEKQWAKYLFKDGSMIGLNQDILAQYVEYITDLRLKAIGFDEVFGATSNPLPWMDAWLVSDNVQVAPQESEISSYLVGAIDSELDDDDFGDFDL
ncbi:MAG: ribonucleotide-diphosphate reductase subunit beta [Saccharospirillaceae bacterium]|nr:ribonucleotide-diphosphate reductase subunit beta [Pseudomonadales bacterium]NRB78831.1 ribonucleotide-diphosphate reductase subunit beta [Saccharospirillaceae bacterium]